MPGVSRSGITITAGRLLGLDRDSAARFSFLLLVPITFCRASCSRALTDVVLGRPARRDGRGRSRSACWPRSAAGCSRSIGLLGYVRRHSYDVFVVYRLLAAAIILLLIADRRPRGDVLARGASGPAGSDFLAT